MNNFNPTFDSALTVRGVLRECANSEPVEKFIVRFLEAVGFLLLFFTMMYCLMLGAANQEEWEKNYIVIQGPPEPTTTELGAAHLYHGINFSILNLKTGECYFYRDGEKCPLFAYLNNQARRDQ
jgi:hypothetical protein